MLQNATPLRKSAPGPPNIFDEHVSCAAPATENASLQILFTCPTPANALKLGTASKPLGFAYFWQGAQSPAPATRNDIWTSKSAPYPSVVTFFPLLTWKCASHHNRVHFFDISTSKSGPTENDVLCNILNWKCASRRNAVHFFDMSTSKSGPRLKCLVHFDLEMYLAPQWRALFRRLNFQKCSEPGMSCTFWTLKCASRHNSVQLLISHLARWLRARRSSEPTFRLSGTTNHWKNTVNRDFSWLFYLFAHLHLLSSDSFHLCFSICPYCQKFDF